MSQAEAEFYNRAVKPTAAMAVLNGVDLDYYKPDSSTDQQRACTFVGALDYLPNIDAACWFAREVWPGIMAEFPDAEFRIVGRRPTAEVIAFGSLQGVRVVGQVPDVRPWVHSAMVAVVPIRISRGLQNKVLEAMAIGKPVVAAPPAQAALQTRAGNASSICNDTRRVAHLLFAHCSSPRANAKRWAVQHAAYVEEHHHWDRCLEPLIDAIQAAISRSNLPRQCA